MIPHYSEYGLYFNLFEDLKHLNVPKQDPNQDPLPDKIETKVASKKVKEILRDNQEAPMQIVQEEAKVERIL